MPMTPAAHRAVQPIIDSLDTVLANRTLRRHEKIAAMDEIVKHARRIASNLRDWQRQEEAREDQRIREGGAA